MPSPDTFQTIKLWTKTYRLAKLLSALRGETLVVFFQRLVEQEAKQQRPALESQNRDEQSSLF